MDPNANIQEQLAIFERMAKRHDAHDHATTSPVAAINYYREQIADGDRLAELAKALDAWMEKGGFMPERWMKYRGFIK
jgi:hypothetical protein